MSLSFEDWLKGKHPEIDAEERAKLVEDAGNSTDEIMKSFDYLGQMSPLRAVGVLAGLIAQQSEWLQRLSNEYIKLAASKLEAYLAQRPADS